MVGNHYGSWSEKVGKEQCMEEIPKIKRL